MLMALVVATVWCQGTPLGGAPPRLPPPLNLKFTPTIHTELGTGSYPDPSDSFHIGETRHPIIPQFDPALGKMKGIFLTYEADSSEEVELRTSGTPTTGSVTQW